MALMQNACVMFDKCVIPHKETKFIERLPNALYEIWTIELFENFAKLSN